MGITLMDAAHIKPDSLGDLPYYVSARVLLFDAGALTLQIESGRLNPAAVGDRSR
ncbi:hypothetical protein GCM10025778_21260 [Paeniglutamicibacter antarcticus]|uniref:Uncharacterized protein n=1 Tax=Paeniglutamicibacter antarcticus TaxID=494023 RepID=A0ABP9TPC9_9MICC